MMTDVSPITAADGSDDIGLGGEFVPGLACGVSHID
jgi:hypothetical protein